MVDQIVDTNRSRRGAGAHVYIPRLLENVVRSPTYVKLALWYLHHPAWVEGHTGGSRFTPTVHPCPVRWGGCGWPTQLHEPNNARENAQLVQFEKINLHQVKSVIIVQKMVLWNHGLVENSEYERLE